MKYIQMNIPFSGIVYFYILRFLAVNLRHWNVFCCIFHKSSFIQFNSIYSLPWDFIFWKSILGQSICGSEIQSMVSFLEQISSNSTLSKLKQNLHTDQQHPGSANIRAIDLVISEQRYQFETRAEQGQHVEIMRLHGDGVTAEGRLGRCMATSWHRTLRASVARATALSLKHAHCENNPCGSPGKGNEHDEETRDSVVRERVHARA